MIGYRRPVRQSLLLLLLAALPAAARQTSITPEMDALLRRGIDAIYRMDFDAADRAAEAAYALDPGYPHAYLGQAANDLIRFSYGTEQSDPGEIPRQRDAPLGADRGALRGPPPRRGPARDARVRRPRQVRALPARHRGQGARADGHRAVGLGRPGRRAGRVPARRRAPRDPQEPLDRLERVRAGQLLDALGRREEALAAYRLAYAEPDHWQFSSLIKPCLAKPCVGAKYPGHFSPY